MRQTATVAALAAVVVALFLLLHSQEPAPLATSDVSARMAPKQQAEPEAAPLLRQSAATKPTGELSPAKAVAKGRPVTDEALRRTLTRAKRTRDNFRRQAKALEAFADRSQEDYLQFLEEDLSRIMYEDAAESAERGNVRVKWHLMTPKDAFDGRPYIGFASVPTGEDGRVVETLAPLIRLELIQQYRESIAVLGDALLHNYVTGFNARTDEARANWRAAWLETGVMEGTPQSVQDRWSSLRWSENGNYLVVTKRN